MPDACTATKELEPEPCRSQSHEEATKGKEFETANGAHTHKKKDANAGIAHTRRAWEHSLMHDAISFSPGALSLSLSQSISALCLASVLCIVPCFPIATILRLTNAGLACS